MRNGDRRRLDRVPTGALETPKDEGEWFAMEMERRTRARGWPVPRWSQVLRVVKELGYRLPEKG
jgi:hypothetical protein